MFLGQLLHLARQAYDILGNCLIQCCGQLVLNCDFRALELVDTRRRERLHQLLAVFVALQQRSPRGRPSSVAPRSDQLCHRPVAKSPLKSQHRTARGPERADLKHAISSPFGTAPHVVTRPLRRNRPGTAGRIQFLAFELLCHRTLLLQTTVGLANTTLSAWSRPGSWLTKRFAPP